jgi:tetratricopeptide (TPR) repeat protein
MILACGGWACSRFISVSNIRGGNPVAREDAEQFAVRFQVCADCRKNYCDRCVPVRLLRRARCALCGGRLVDGLRADRVWGNPLPGFVKYHNKGVELTEAGEFKRALTQFDEAVRRRPAYRSAHFQRGVLLARQGRDDDALAAFEQVIRLDSQNAAAQFELGRILRRLDRQTEAVEAYDRALRVQPRYAAAWVHKAVALTDLVRHDEALAACAAALHLGPDAVDNTAHVVGALHAAKATVFLELGRHDDALAAVDASLSEEPDNAETYALRARVLEKLGRTTDALSDRQQAEQLRTSRCRRIADGSGPGL